MFFHFLNYSAIFYGICSPGSTMSGIWAENSFLSFSACLIQIWLKIMPNSSSLIFFFCYFFGIFSTGSSMSGIGAQNSFHSFSACLILIWQKLMPNSCSLIFWIFLLFFFRNFLSRAEYERNLGLKFFSLFLGLSLPHLAKNNAEKLLCNFFNFFAIFFGICPPGSIMSGIRV